MSLHVRGTILREVPRGYAGLGGDPHDILLPYHIIICKLWISNDSESKQMAVTSRGGGKTRIMLRQFDKKGFVHKTLRKGLEMSILQIHMQSDGQVLEVLPEEVENAELAVEDAVCQVLLDLFGGGSVDDVSIQFSPASRRSRQCSIQVHAQCSYQSFALMPRTNESMELVVERKIRPIMTELFGRLKVECVILTPSARNHKNDPAIQHTV